MQEVLLPSPAEALPQEVAPDDSTSHGEALMGTCGSSSKEEAINHIFQIAPTDCPRRELQERETMHSEGESSYGLSTRVFQTYTPASNAIPTKAFQNPGTKLF